MSKKVQRVPDKTGDAALDAISDALVAEGAMLPVDAQQLTDDELSLFGEGRGISIWELRQNVEIIERRISQGVKEDHANEISESMAMAARNGDQISQAVLERMISDRLRAEKSSKA